MKQRSWSGPEPKAAKPGGHIDGRDIPESLMSPPKPDSEQESRRIATEEIQMHTGISPGRYEDWEHDDRDPMDRFR